MDIARTQYYTKTTELKEDVISYLRDKMKDGSDAEKKEIALACLKSRLFDESTTIKTDVVNYTIKEHGDTVISTEPVAEDSSK